jgi:colanic acid biosynthesis glycosyl transferase WcaI
VRLLLLTMYYPPEIGAASLRMAEMVNDFSKQKDTEHVTVLVFNPDQKARHPRQHTKIADNVDIVRYIRRYFPRGLHRVARLNPFNLLCWIVFSIREARRASPDIIMATVPPHFNPAIAAYITSIICRKRFCIDIRDFWKGINDYALKSRPFYLRFLVKAVEYITEALFRRSCKKARMISVVYEGIQKYLVEEMRLSAPVVLVPNGVNFPELERIKQGFDKAQVLRENGIVPKQGAKFIIYTGAIGGYYKPEALLLPLMKLVEKGYRIGYIVVGEYTTNEIMAKTAADMGIERRVFLLGEREHSRVIELLLASDVAFYALDEDFPNPECALGVKVLEYIGCKLPILSIAGERSIVAKLITENKIGVALKWSDTGLVTGALESLLHSQEYIKNIERYYPSFAETFDRCQNNSRLYGEITKQLTYVQRHATK